MNRVLLLAFGVSSGCVAKKIIILLDALCAFPFDVTGFFGVV